MPATFLVGNGISKKPLYTFRPRWEDNIKMDLQEYVGTVDSGHGQLAGSCEYGNKPFGSVYDMEFD
jgi:hypothetical protein